MEILGTIIFLIISITLFSLFFTAATTTVINEHFFNFRLGIIGFGIMAIIIIGILYSK